MIPWTEKQTKKLWVCSWSALISAGLGWSKQVLKKPIKLFLGHHGGEKFEDGDFYLTTHSLSTSNSSEPWYLDPLVVKFFLGKHDFFRFLWQIFLLRDQKYSTKIFWRSVRSTVPLTGNQWVFETNQYICTPCRWWFCRKT